MTSRPTQEGFSVIEALVAIAVIALALVPLLALQIQVSRDHVRQRAVREEITAQRNALAFLRDANMMATPRGERALGEGQSVRWIATPLTRLVRTTDRGSGDGAFEVVLYRVQVTTEGPGDATPYTFDVEQLGWRPVAAARSSASRETGGTIIRRRTE